MKNTLFTILALLLCSNLYAQEVRFAYVDADSVMRSLPAYADAQKQLAMLCRQYEQEVLYNEQAFQRQFSEFLEGQKDFPEAILLKRQRDLQDALEKGLAFRRDCDKLLKEAEHDILQPIREEVEAAIREEGREGHYTLVFPHAPLYANPGTLDDITARVIARMIRQQNVRISECEN